MSTDGPLARTVTEYGTSCEFPARSATCNVSAFVPSVKTTPAMVKAFEASVVAASDVPTSEIVAGSLACPAMAAGIVPLADPGVGTRPVSDGAVQIGRAHV